MAVIVSLLEDDGNAQDSALLEWSLSIELVDSEYDLVSLLSPESL
jgi:hypothetical protein